MTYRSTSNGDKHHATRDGKSTECGRRIGQGWDRPRQPTRDYNACNNCKTATYYLWPKNDAPVTDAEIGDLLNLVQQIKYDFIRLGISDMTFDGDTDVLYEVLDDLRDEIAGAILRVDPSNTKEFRRIAIMRNPHGRTPEEAETANRIADRLERRLMEG